MLERYFFRYYRKMDQRIKLEGIVSFERVLYNIFHVCMVIQAVQRH